MLIEIINNELVELIKMSKNYKIIVFMMSLKNLTVEIAVQS